MAKTTELETTILDNIQYVDVNAYSPQQRRRFYSTAIDGHSRREAAIRDGVSKRSIRRSLREINHKIANVRD